MTNESKLLGVHKISKALYDIKAVTADSLDMLEDYSLHIRGFSETPSCIIYNTFITSSKVQIKFFPEKRVIKFSGMSEEEEKLMAAKLDSWLPANTSLLLSLNELTSALEKDKAGIINSMELPAEYNFLMPYSYGLPIFLITNEENNEKEIGINVIPGAEPLVKANGVSAKESLELRNKVTEWLVK